MAKVQLVPALAALCLFSSLATFALATVQPPFFVVQGRVYCDTCRAGFETRATEYLSGAKVKLECKHFATGAIAHTVEGVTDSSGTFSLQVENDHEEEICEVVLVESPVKGCSEIKDGRDRARVLLTQGSGISTNLRYANSLGFLKDEPLASCGELLREYLGDEE